MSKRSPAKKPTQKRVTWYPKVDFAFKNGMITEYERDECYNGNMAVNEDCKTLMNLNTKHKLQTGTATLIYSGRVDQLKIDRLLGLDDD